MVWAASGGGLPAGGRGYGSAGVGSNIHVFGAWFNDLAGLDMVHVPSHLCRNRYYDRRNHHDHTKTTMRYPDDDEDEHDDDAACVC